MRLIDADKLKDSARIRLNEIECKRFCRITDAEPTAYEVDELISDLEKLRDDGYVTGITNNLYEAGAISALNNAIEIVKAGGKYDK